MYITGNGDKRVTEVGSGKQFSCGKRNWRGIPNKETPIYLLKIHPNNSIAQQHTFIPCGGKSIPCGNSGNMPERHNTRVFPGGDNARASSLVEIHRCFFLAVTSVTKTNVCFSCVNGNICPKFGVTYIHPWKKIGTSLSWHMSKHAISEAFFDRGEAWCRRGTWISGAPP